MKLFSRILMAVALLTASFVTNSATWINTTGKITNETGTPICAMVLSNGQHMFSCAGAGAYKLHVPLAQDGTVTLMVFASGFEPYRMTLTSGQATSWNVNMIPDVDGRLFDVYYNVTTSQRLGWVTVSGDIEVDGAPLCSMVLSNGQSMFSCGVNLGKYSMEVPLDYNGVVTLMSFVSGFAPLRGDLDIPPPLLSQKQAERLNGTWVGTSNDGQTSTYVIDGHNILEFADFPGGYGVLGTNPSTGSDVVAWWDDVNQIPGAFFLVELDAGVNYDLVYSFNFVSPNKVSGEVCPVYNETTLGECQDFTATR